MNIPNDLYDAAKRIVSRYGYILTAFDWDEDNPVMRIDYHHEGLFMSIIVRGVPTDIPIDVFCSLLDHMVRTKIRKEGKSPVPANVVSWFSQNR